MALLKTALLFQDKKAYPHCGKKNQVGKYNGQTVDRFLRIGVLDKFDPNSRSSQVYQSAVVHQNYLYFIDGTKAMLSRANLDDCKTKRTDCIRLVIFQGIYSQIWFAHIWNLTVQTSFLFEKKLSKNLGQIQTEETWSPCITFRWPLSFRSTARKNNLQLDFWSATDDRTEKWLRSKLYGNLYRAAETSHDRMCQNWPQLRVGVLCADKGVHYRL